MAKDLFIDIASSGIGGRAEFLYEPKPPVYDRKECILQSNSLNASEVEEKMHNASQLKEELLKMREKYKPFLKNYSPVFEKYSERKYLTEFILDGKEITLPSYGGPVGNAVKVYETKFEISELPASDKAAFICFKGVDYKCEVTINDEFIGCHEGFFSPFEFEISEVIKKGENKLKIKVKNDFRYNGDYNSDGELIEGDKLYAATGLGWDDPETGWHHCPAGMGIYNDVYIEFRNRIHIHDVFVRPLLNKQQAEVRIEVNNTEYIKKNVVFLISLYGQNFKETLFEKKEFNPSTIRTVGMGDTFTQSQLKQSVGSSVSSPAQKGLNLYKFIIPVDNLKLWELEKPYLYRIRVELLYNGKITDGFDCQFGMREFTQDTEHKPYGMFYLNGKKIRLRGANTMGFEQQDVLRKDYSQLIDDILYAKICNMNFLRLTQRPVQKEVYEYCDMLGLMTQTDLPIFGSIRRPEICEALRQVEEMEHLIRNHACNVIISYINEPFPNANNAPHRHLTRPEMEEFFACCDRIVHMSNPDRVIKHIDGDYDPPTEGMPDNHCYTMWYNGHGIDLGKLYKGYWMQVKPDWYFGCGEFGAEGLENVETMKKYYPEGWLNEPFNPSDIIKSQSWDMHYSFFDEQDNVEKWVYISQKYQAFATKIMTESFRRNSLMVSCAIHLFIDAWPSGWMKTIMDCDRNPKEAYFAYRNALEPVFLSLRCDKRTYTTGEKISIENVIANDTNKEGEGYKVYYEVYSKEKLVLSGQSCALLKDCDVSYVSDIVFTAPKVDDREKLLVKAVLKDSADNVITYNTIEIEVFSDVKIEKNDKVCFVGPLKEGKYNIAGEDIEVKDCGMLPVYFASVNTNHKIVKNFESTDFSYWYDEKAGRMTPILYATFTSDTFEKVVMSGNKNDNGKWNDAYAVGIKEYEGKLYILCQLDLRCENPVAKRFIKNIYDYAKTYYKM